MDWYPLGDPAPTGSCFGRTCVIEQRLGTVPGQAVVTSCGGKVSEVRFEADPGPTPRESAALRDVQATLARQGWTAGEAADAVDTVIWRYTRQDEQLTLWVRGGARPRLVVTTAASRCADDLPDPAAGGALVGTVVLSDAVLFVVAQQTPEGWRYGLTAMSPGETALVTDAWARPLAGMLLSPECERVPMLPWSDAIAVRGRICAALAGRSATELR